METVMEKVKTMAKVNDLQSMRFGKLSVIHKDESNKNGYAVWVCQCDCGNITKVRSRSLTTGNTKSCGCGRYEKPKKCKYCGIVFVSFSTRANCCGSLECNEKKAIDRKESSRSYYEKNLCKLKDSHKDYYEKNKKRHKEMSFKYYEENKVRQGILKCYRTTIGDRGDSTEKEIVIASIAIACVNGSNNKNIDKVIKERVEYAESRKILWK